MRLVVQQPPAPVGSAPAVVAVAAVIAAFMIGGVPGAFIVLVAAIDVGAERSRLPVGVALALLMVAALATVLEAPLLPSIVGLDFALDRPVASAAGLFAGVAALVAVLFAAVEERSPRIIGNGARPLHRPLADVLPAPAAALPAAAAAALVAVCSALRPGPALPTTMAMSVANLRAGVVDELAAVAPLPPLAIVVLPGDASWATVIVRTLAVMAALRLVGRVAGTRVTVAAGLVVTAVISLSGAGMAETLALLWVAVAVLWAWPAEVTPVRAAFAGLFLAAAALSRADAILVLPVVAGCLVVGAGRRRGSALSLVVTTSVVVTLFLLGLQRRLGTWWAHAGSDVATSWRWWAPLLAAVLLGALLSRPRLHVRRVRGTAGWEPLEDQAHDEPASPDGCSPESGPRGAPS